MSEKIKIADKTQSYTIMAFYNFYLDNIERDTTYDIEYSLYRKIVTEYFQYLRDELIEKSKRVRLPYRMGYIQIVKHKPKFYDRRSLRIDYQASKQYGKMIFLTNEHSDFYKYRLYYNKTDMLVPNKSKYQLVLTRANKRRLAQIIKNHITDYEEL